MENIVITEDQFDERFTMLKNHFYNDTKLYYQSGFHIVNRLGFFFTEEEVTEDHLTVVIDITPDV